MAEVTSVLSIRASLAFVLSLVIFASPAWASGTTTSSAHKRALHHTTSSHTISGHPATAHTTTVAYSRSHHAASRKRHVLHGQQAIDPARVTEIQQALIREHYMTGEANGEWNSTTQAAMQKYQADHGWQTKLMPDSRAIKALGLGPDYSTAINANTSSFGAPPPVSTIPAPQAAGFAAASGTDH
jgi:hypothetical protein